MFAAHSGWLNSKPEGSSDIRLDLLAGSQAVNMPETGDLYLYKLASDAGLAKMSGGFIEPLSWSDIGSFSNITKRKLSPFEAKAIREISSSYVAWVLKGQAKFCASPFYNDKRTIEQMRSDVSAQIKASRGL